MQISEKAYAKVNLFLDVTGKRRDGFHELCTVMHAVTLADEVEMEVMPSSYSCITIAMENSDIPADERNLAYLAAEAFLERTELSAAVQIRIRKNIPAAAGLGGGSSDAAAVLRGLNEALGHPLSVEALLEVAETLGSDVPFCLVGGTRVCRGRGERMQPYHLQNDDLIFVIYMPSAEKMSTPRAYAALDATFGDFADPQTELHEALYEFFREDEVLGMYNIFESVVLPECPLAEEARAKLLYHGATNAMMSGSGAAVFGVFTEEEKAKEAAAELPGAVICRSAAPVAL